MRLIVKDEEIERVRSNLQSASTLSEALCKDWISDNLLKKEERLKKHALFWLILDRDKCKILDNWLQILKNSLPQSKFTGIVNNLKRKRGEIEFYSYLSEIEALAFYKRLEGENLSVEFEPSVPGKTNVGDIKLITDNREIFLEITRLFSSEEERKFDELIEKVREEINELEANPYIVSFGISEDFSENDVTSFVEFIRNKIIETEQSPVKVPSGKIPFRNKAWFSLDKKLESGRGFVGMMMPPVIEIKSAGRLKNKILDEIRQLPEDHLNLVVLNISHHFTDFEDVENAFAGQLALKINLRTLEDMPIRKANGVIDMKEGKHVSAIVAFKDFDYENRRIYINSQAFALLTNESLEKI